MKCQCCNTTIEPGDERDHFGRILCEDCYIDALSPLKACDPWAVHSAKTFEEHTGGTGTMTTLTALQTKILEILKAKGPLAPEDLLKELKVDLTLPELQREFAALRHMEKARAEKKGDTVVWRLWDG